MACSNVNILLTGVTGYIGGRLLSRLVDRDNYFIRCLARNTEFVVLDSDVSNKNVEVVQGDLADYESLVSCLEGVDVAIYLVHAMGTSGNLEDIERQYALNFIKAATFNRVKKIIYLGGLSLSSDVSSHLRSRKHVGEILRNSDIPVVEFRASIIIGAGSLSYEIMRSLCERLPVMTPPRWVMSLCQPIGVEDVLQYIQKAIEIDFKESRIYEIGGPDRVNYRELMLEYSRQRGLKRYIITVPLLTPYLSALWLGLITPVYARIGRKLIMSLETDTIVTDDAALKDFSINPKGYREAIMDALLMEKKSFIENRWCNAVSSRGVDRASDKFIYPRESISLRCRVNATRLQAYDYVSRLGGKTGWLYCNCLWRLRGALDLMCGGVGMQRGRRVPDVLLVGDYVDCWRVEYLRAGSIIRLRSEMAIPGRGWLQFEFNDTSAEAQETEIVLTALFEPRGRLGIIYWYILFVPHWLLFRGLLRELQRKI
jgi:uncharacterized protein YbjT (DUF2867 family)